MRFSPQRQAPTNRSSPKSCTGERKRAKRHPTATCQKSHDLPRAAPVSRPVSNRLGPTGNCVARASRGARTDSPPAVRSPPHTHGVLGLPCTFPIQWLDDTLLGEPAQDGVAVAELGVALPTGPAQVVRVMEPRRSPPDLRPPETLFARLLHHASGRDPPAATMKPWLARPGTHRRPPRSRSSCAGTPAPGRTQSQGGYNAVTAAAAPWSRTTCAAHRAAQADRPGGLAVGLIEQTVRYALPVN
jgi:hypothetical protein